MRKLTFASTAFVLTMIAWVLYLEYSKKQFIESLPELPPTIRQQEHSASQNTMQTYENSPELTEMEITLESADNSTDAFNPEIFTGTADMAPIEWESGEDKPELESDEIERSAELEALFLGFSIFEEEMKAVITVLDPMIQESISITNRQQEISHELSEATDSTARLLYKERRILLGKEAELAPQIFEFQKKRNEIDAERSDFLEEYGFSSRKDFFEIHQESYRAWGAER